MSNSVEIEVSVHVHRAHFRRQGWFLPWYELWRVQRGGVFLSEQCKYWNCIWESDGLTWRWRRSSALSSLMVFSRDGLSGFKRKNSRQKPSDFSSSSSSWWACQMMFSSMRNRQYLEEIVVEFYYLWLKDFRSSLLGQWRRFHASFFLVVVRNQVSWISE